MGVIRRASTAARSLHVELMVIPSLRQMPRGHVRSQVYVLCREAAWTFGQCAVGAV